MQLQSRHPAGASLEGSSLPPDAEHDRMVIAKTSLLLVAVMLNMVEFFIPRIPFIPWLKPGIANCVTIVWIMRFGAVDALIFTALRVWIVGFFFGLSFLTLTLALSGGLASTLIMGAAWRLLGQRGFLGTVGLGVIGAVTHNISQLAVVYALMVRNAFLFYQIPFMLGASIIFGGLVGVLTPLMRRLSESKDADSVHLSKPTIDQRPGGGSITGSVMLIALCVAIVFIGDLTVLGAIAVAVTVGVQILVKGSWRALVQPIRRFWLLFLFVALIDGLLSYGKRLTPLPFPTEEGLLQVSQQWLRLWIWLQLTCVFDRLKFNAVLFGALRWIFPRRETVLEAGLRAVECFPAALDRIRAEVRISARTFVKHPFASGRQAIEKVFAVTAETVREPRKM